MESGVEWYIMEYDFLFSLGQGQSQNPTFLISSNLAPAQDELSLALCAFLLQPPTPEKVVKQQKVNIACSLTL